MSYALGFDFGSESGRCLLVEVDTGVEVASAVHRYPLGVLDRQLPDGRKLGLDWALQHPTDYLTVLEVTTRAVLRQSGVAPEEVIGIGTACTACSVLPTLADGTPLCLLEQWQSDPHAWIKLWKHHAAQPWAERITALAERRNEPWLATYGGRISSEWLFPKVAQIADEAPEVYDAADQFVEVADWIVWQLTGVATRNACSAGYKALWDADRGYPSRDFCQQLHPRLVTLPDKLSKPVAIGQRAGELSAAMAARLGLRAGVAVAVGNVDAHVSLPACGTTDHGVLVAIMGTSCCHVLCGPEKKVVPGICGVVKDGIIPGAYGFEAGQSGFGDHFAWLMRFLGGGESDHAALEHEAAKVGPGGSGLLALDWWNGNRSVLVDASLTGLLVGLDLQTTPADVYRALIEGLAFGTRMIIETFTQAGVRIDRIIACGGLAEKNRLFMQTIADVTGRTIQLARSAQASALGAAIFAAVAAGKRRGGHDDLAEAARLMGGVKELAFTPNPALRGIYNQLFNEYRTLHDYFGKANQVMRRLKEMRVRAGERSAASGG